jgi:hypothetical protein
LATNRKTEYLARMVHWPTVCASEVRQGFQDRSRGMKGSQESLTTAVILHGQAAPVSGSSLGSRQGLWLTPRANEPTGDSTFVTRNGDRGQHCSPSLTIQVEKTPQWMTPRACEAQNPPMGVDKRHHGLTHQVTKQWATPKTPTGGPETAKRKQELGRTASGGGDLASQANGKLNPRWVETLMGLPIGWTMPSCTSPQTIELTSCDSSAMELSQPPQSEPSEFSLAS